jgi:hypothetical protein
MNSNLGRGMAAIIACAIIAACGSDPNGAPTSPDPGTVGSGNGFAAAAACTPDATPPVIAGSVATPNVLWPPNHKFVPATIATSVSDDCDPTPHCAISSVSSNEPVNGLGDGDTSPDWMVTGASTLLLRSERSGTGSGRVYTVGTTCTDAAGNGVVGYATVSVPHDQGDRAGS